MFDSCRTGLTTPHERPAVADFIETKSQKTDAGDQRYSHEKEGMTIALKNIDIGCEEKIGTQIIIVNADNNRLFISKMAKSAKGALGTKTKRDDSGPPV